MTATRWEQWRFLLGKWEGEGGGDPGQGAGWFTFEYDLQQTVLVRRDHASYPAAGDRPSFAHDDLMVVYQPDGAGARAVYFDNEGHVIHYAVELAPERGTLVFLSDVIPGAPRFRFTYRLAAADRLGIAFDIAPPGNPEAFSPYIQATAQRAIA